VYGYVALTLLIEIKTIPLQKAEKPILRMKEPLSKQPNSFQPHLPKRITGDIVKIAQSDLTNGVEGCILRNVVRNGPSS
jgi:hypothetical protein